MTRNNTTMAKQDRIVPEQHVGNKLDTTHEVSATSREHALAVFDTAVQRLFDVNHWDKICGPLSAVFTLTNERGEDIEAPPRPGFHFKIDVPGPGPSAGDGFDWVQIEAVDDQRNPSSEEESITIRVRPSESPLNNEPSTAHFFDPAATSSFQVKRMGNIVRAEVHGRNELPNVQADRPADKVRNAMVGGGAIAGMSAPQWKGLVTGLLSEK
jgi:hypothetical protein